MLGSAVAGSCFMLALLCVLPTHNVAHREMASTEPDADTALVEDGLTSVAPSQETPVSEETISSKMPDKPLPGQRRPPCTPEDSLVEIKGGCWMPQKGVPLPCGADWYEYNGRCYAPFMRTERSPNSADPKAK